MPRDDSELLDEANDLRQEVEGRAERAELQRDAAISLLIEAPAECSELQSWKRNQRDMGDARDWDGLDPDREEPGACGRCWPCRVDKFLRDAGVRR